MVYLLEMVMIFHGKVAMSFNQMVYLPQILVK